MASLELNDSVILSDYGKPYIVAELNTSHFGKLETAKLMIDKVKEAGCDCVKFQSWTADTLYSQDYYDENPIAKRFIKKFSLSPAELEEVLHYCRSSNIGFSSTPYSREEVDFLLEKCKVPYLKIASMDLNNIEYLKYIAGSGSAIVLSTGMGDMDEIYRAVNTIVKAGNDNLCILHCVSIYPTDTSKIRLNNILGLRKEFPNHPIGFSDHSLGIEMPSAAAALGACMFEKHFTLDKEKIGMDNQMAINSEEMISLVSNVHNVHQALGGHERVVYPEELKQRKIMRRSVVFADSLTKGTELTLDDLDVKRPGIGFQPESINDLVGAILTRDVEENTLVKSSDVLMKNKI
jgi:sialic acid synthase SpsE